MFGFFKKFDRQKKLAENGNPIAQYDVGCCYHNGDGVPQDYDEALKWFRKAAEQGIAEAEYRLGLWWLHQSSWRREALSWAESLEKEAELKAEASKWFRLAADQGYAPAQFQLGRYYEYGCVSRTFDKQLRGSYEDGRVTRNLAEAYKWFHLASAQGYVDEIIQSPATTYRDAVAAEIAKMTPDEITFLGVCYYTGKNVPKDYAEALKWFRKAADQGNAKAQFDLGVCYDTGKGVPQDYAEAVKWYRKAAEQGKANAQLNLGCCYSYGRGIAQDYVEAVKWYRKSAEQNYAIAQCNLGDCYEKGKGVNRDYLEAVKWYRKASEQNLPVAHCSLGDCYTNGWGVAKDFIEAYKWFHLASELGYSDATTERDALAALMTPDQIAEAQRLAREFQPHTESATHL